MRRLPKAVEIRKAEGASTAFILNTGIEGAACHETGTSEPFLTRFVQLALAVLPALVRQNRELKKEIELRRREVLLHVRMANNKQFEVERDETVRHSAVVGLVRDIANGKSVSQAMAREALGMGGYDPELSFRDDLLLLSRDWHNQSIHSDNK